MTKHMIEETRYDLGEERYKQLMDAFKKSDINAYSILEQKDAKLVVNEEYKKAFEKIKHIACDKALKNAEQADGMATRMQKALMTRNAIGALALIHRQYIPLMLQQTWGKRVYDYDAQEYKGGQFRTLFSYLRNLCCSNALAASGMGAFVGFAFGGFSPISIIACSSISLAASLAHKIKTHGKRKNLAETNREFFDNSFTNVLRNRRSGSISSKSSVEYAEKL